MRLSPGTEVGQVGHVWGQDAGGALEQPLGLALRLHLPWKMRYDFFLIDIFISFSGVNSNENKTIKNANSPSSWIQGSRKKILQYLLPDEITWIKNKKTNIHNTISIKIVIMMIMFIIKCRTHWAATMRRLSSLPKSLDTPDLRERTLFLYLVQWKQVNFFNSAS